MKKAFTLAEVLITLTIVGVVAAVTIPSVIANYQQQEFKTGLRKAVSVLNSAIQTSITHEGETPYENNNLYEYLQKHMSVLKKVEYESKYDSNQTFFTTDGMRYEIPTCTESFRFKNIKLHESGISGIGYCHSSNCGSYGLKSDSKTKNTPCLVTVDVNGDRKPSPAYKDFANKESGRLETRFGNLYPDVSDKRLTDVFNILITEDRAIPFGVVAQRAMYEK